MAVSIQEEPPKIKFFEKWQGFVIPALVVLVGVASFGLGRVSRGERADAVTIQNVSQEPAEPRVLGGLVVASKSGDKYHFPWCAGANSIKAANRLWFKDEAAARKAGYTPAGNCKGLK